MSTRACRNGTPAEAEPVMDDPRMVRAVQEYLDAMEAGHRPDRDAFLARHHDLAGPLAECLEALEFVHDVGPRLDGPAAPATPPSPLAAADLAIPLGDFRLVREVGRGGMGVVYEAEQLSLGRRIALKVLPFALTLDPRQLQRFKNEARAAAQLHHTNIVPIYSVGCERGVHFYAMQYIEGQTLADVIAELRQLTSPGAARRHAGADEPTGPYVPPSPEAAPATTAAGPRLAGTTYGSRHGPAFFRTVAQLGVQAAEALEHAHGLGVIHRDVKPANLLLDACGRLWVTDFGLAQFKSDAALTMTGDLLGTLRYMSPEQALAKRGLVDHRTDVYSLGVTLYELLTLEPAVGGRDREELLRQIAFDEPRAPRRLNRAVPADLETVVLKAMAKRVEDRYATAQELADDLRRFLEQKPIHARRPTPLERAARWSRRHRAVVAAAVAVLALAALGLAASTVLVAREQANTRTAYDRLADEQARTRSAYEAEARNFRQARLMLDFFTQVSEEELADKPEAQEARRKLLQAALEYYQDFIEQCRDDPEAQEELVASHLHVANLLNEMGARSEALASLEQARRLQEKLVRDHPSVPEYHGRLSFIDHNLGWLRDGGQLLLLEQPAVRAELKLSADQARRLTQLADKWRQAQREHRDQGPEGARARFEELAAQEKALVEELRPEQARRLKQIAWQQAGAGAFGDPEVAAALALTDRQKERIRAIQDEARRAAHGGPRPGGRRPGDGKKTDDVWRSAWEQALNVLTADQKARWKELTGEPFRGAVRAPYPGGFDPRPGPWGPKKP